MMLLWDRTVCVIKHDMLIPTDMLARRDSVELILSNGLTLGVLVAIFLHLVLPYHEDDDSLTVVIDGDAKPAKGVNVSASDEESVDGKVRVVLARFPRTPYSSMLMVTPR